MNGFRYVPENDIEGASWDGTRLMVLHDYGSNAILAEPIKNRQAATTLDAFFNIHKVLKARGSDPKVYIIDNDFYSDLK